MKTYKFIQIYNYGDNWNGELINIPESAIFYNVDKTEYSQEWYIIIPLKDFNDNYKGKGCVQVNHYILFNYAIIHLKNINPIDKWNDIGEEKYHEMFDDIINKWYIYTYDTAKYKLTDDITKPLEKISDEVLISVGRIKNLIYEGKVNTTTVYIKNYFDNNINNYSITQQDYDLGSIEYYTDEENENTITEIDEYEGEEFNLSDYKKKLIITKNPTLYNKYFKEAAENLF